MPSETVLITPTPFPAAVRHGSWLLLACNRGSARCLTELIPPPPHLDLMKLKRVGKTMTVPEQEQQQQKEQEQQGGPDSKSQQQKLRGEAFISRNAGTIIGVL